MNLGKNILLFFIVLINLHGFLESRTKKNKSIVDRSLRTQIDVPDNFGKTHFIVGLSSENVAKLKSDKKEKSPIISSDSSFNLICDGCIKQVLFSPDDNIQKILLYLIENETESIRLTAYSFTDGDVAQALIQAHNRGVRVEIVADPACMHDRFGKVPMIKEHDVIVFIYNPDHLKNDKKNLTSSIMHNKFIIFGKNVLGKSVLWTGSFNWTKAAHKRNQENVLILDDKHFVDKYVRHFERLKERCINHKPKKAVVVQQKQKCPVDFVLSKKGTLFEFNEVSA